MGVIGEGFRQAEDVWQSKWPLVTHTVLNQQLGCLACDTKHNNQC